MLGDIRKNAKHPLIQGLLAVIILVFVLFFGWSMRSDKGKGSAVASVNGDPITADEYRTAYGNIIDLYSRITGQRLSAEQAQSLGLDKRALEQLVDQKLLFQEADRRNFSVSDEELAAAISRQPAFEANGAFSRDRYAQVLAGAGLTPERYEQMKRQELLLGKVESAVKATAIVTEEDIVKEFKARRLTVAVDYAEFDPEKFNRQVLVSGDKLKSFYEAEGEKFRVEEMRRARYVFFPAEAYFDQVPVSDADAKKEFDRNPSMFGQPALVRARHILIRVDRDTDPEKAKAKIAKLKEEIAGGRDFAAVAREHSQDPGSKASGGDLGYFPRNTMVPEFDKAVFALKVGEVSQPVQTQFGYHLIKVEEKKDERDRTFEEAKAEVIKMIKREKAIDLAYKDADNTLMDLEQKKVDWDALGKKRDVKTTAFLTASERDPAAPNVRGFMEALFEMPESKVGQALESRAGAFIISVAERKPAQIPPLEAIRAEVEAKFKVVEGKKLAKAAAEKFAVDASTRGWNPALASNAVFGTSETFSQKGGSIPPLGSAPEGVKAIFEKPETGRAVPSSFEIGDKFYAFRISASSQPDMSSLGVDREKITAEILPAKQSQAVEAFLKSLRDSAKIEGMEQFGAPAAK